MKHMNQLDEDGLLCIAGPMGDDGDTRGIMISQAYPRAGSADGR